MQTKLFELISYDDQGEELRAALHRCHRFQSHLGNGATSHHSNDYVEAEIDTELVPNSSPATNFQSVRRRTLWYPAIKFPKGASTPLLETIGMQTKLFELLSSYNDQGEELRAAPHRCHRFQSHLGNGATSHHLGSRRRR
jgi:hypothetical protein